MRSRRAPSRPTVRGLKDSIDVVVDITAGEDFSKRCGTFTHGINVRFNSVEDLDEYQKHKEHIRVRDEVMKPLMSQTPMAMDYVSPRHQGAHRDRSFLRKLLSPVLPERLITPAIAITVGLIAGFAANDVRKALSK